MNYTTGSDALDAYRESLYSGAAPRLYSIGAGELSRFEIGPGLVCMVGGIPGGGKTAFVAQATIDALRSTPDLRALIANVEMSNTALLDRQVARLSGVSLDVIRHRKLDESHAGRIDAALTTLDAIAARLAFLNQPYTLENVAAAADAHHSELIVIDYLQRFPPPGKHGDARTAMNSTMNYLRRFAAAGCAMLVVSAVGRTKDKAGRSSYDADGLNLASFKESGELEYGVNGGWILIPDPREPGAVTLRHVKSRDGEMRDIRLWFDGAHQSFTAVASRGDATSEGLAALWESTPAEADA